MTSAAHGASHPSYRGWPGRTTGQVPQGWAVPVVDPNAAYQQALGAGLIVHQADPMNAETPLSALTGTLVPQGRHYVRNHFRIPRLDAATWRLRVGGLAGRTLSLSLADLRSMAPRTVVVIMECAGNGRSGLDRSVPGEQWGLGAAGTAQWTGVPLTEVLDRAAGKRTGGDLPGRGSRTGRGTRRAGAVRAFPGPWPAPFGGGAACVRHER